MKVNRAEYKGTMEGLKVSDANMVVNVHPSKSNNVHQSILRELSSLLFTFNENFDGVVLAYEFNILNKSAKVLNGVHPYFSVKLKAKLLLFSPKANMLMEGKVVKLTQGSIHVIVFGLASAAITDDDIRKEFVYKTKHGEERFSSRCKKRHVIKVGTMIRFLVKSFDEEILHISGSLIPAHTGCVRWLETHLDEVSVTESNKKRKEVEEFVSEETVMVEDKALLPRCEEMIKKSKKQMRQDS